MSAIVEVRDRIQKTIARLAEYERAARLPGAPPSLVLSIRSLEKVREDLERDFARLARDEELELCRYRLIPSHGNRQTVTAIARTWMRYQDLFSSVYDSIKNADAPKRSRTRKESLAETQFGFAYTFPGSVGVVLTLPSDSTNYEMARNIERTALTIAEMAASQTPSSLADFVERLGVPPVVKLGSWVDAQVAFGAGAGIEWDIAGNARPNLLVQVEEFTILKSAMDEMTKPTEVTEPVAGLLVAADFDKRTFRMKLDKGERISGEFTDAITLEQKAELPQRYSALVRTTTVIKPAIEKREVSYFLVRLIERLGV